MSVAYPLKRVAVALDTSEWETFRSWCEAFGGRVGVLKIGLEAFVRWGSDAVREARGRGSRIFLDLKLHDIPNTVAGAVRSARELGVDFLTIHAGGGPPAMRAAAEAAGDDLAILAVTLLTHLDDESLSALDMPGPSRSRVERWAALAAASGCSGVVCSPLELSSLRPTHPAPFLLVTPGIRPAGAGLDDQKRTATPAQAVSLGSDLLVIGRPLTRATDREVALAALAEELSD